MITLSERFWSKVTKTHPSDDACWLWTKAVNQHGYGKFGIDGRWVLAHRWIWEHTYGPIGSGLNVLHHCDNPPCVRLSHLYLGTQSDNIRDRVLRNRNAAQLRGDRNPNTRLMQVQRHEVKRLYAQGQHTLNELAHQFGVSKSLIHKIVRYER